MRAAPILAVAATLAAGPGRADQPPLRPSRDVDVTYRAGVAAADGTAVEQRVRWLAAAQVMRIDPPTAGLFVIIDYVAGRMSVVEEAEKTVIDMPAPHGRVEGVPGGQRGGYARRGDAVVADIPCTEWDTLDRDARPATVCITADGVLLRASLAGRTLVSAIAVRYGPQDPVAFRAPAGYVHHSAEATR